MKVTKLLNAALLTCAFGITAAEAQNRQPAEFPPTSYKGKQYVDSAGCVFIRAGIDGNVSWVPRVSRTRKTVCGFKPTGTSRVAAAAPETTEKPVQITLDNAAPVATPPAPKPTVVAAPRPRRVAPAAPVVVRQTAPKPRPRVVAKPVIIAAPVAPAPVQPVQVATTRQSVTSCPGASAVSQQYLRGDGRTAVRCGPQAHRIISSNHFAPAQPRATTSQQPIAAAAAPVVAVASRRAAPAAAAPIHVASNTRIVPKHVAENRVNTTNVSVPNGYKKVWKDGRLNPYRAEQTLGGRQQMLLVWTQTLPRRLIDQNTGRDVTASTPLVYPFVDMTRQRRELGDVSIVQRNGQVMKRVVRHSNAAPIKRQPVYSSRSAPAKIQPKPAAPQTRATTGHRFVQVGTFANSGNAQRAAQRIAQMGMPARIGKYRKGSKTYMTVMAGPFYGAGSTQQATSRLRGAGFSDAYPRK